MKQAGAGELQALQGARSIVACAFALLADPAAAESGPEAAWLCEHLPMAGGAPGLEAAVQAALADWQQDPPAGDERLHALALAEGLGLPEVLALALARAVETDAMAARALSWLQHPVGDGRPSVGLIAGLCARLGEADAAARLACGRACRDGLIQLTLEERPLVERGVRVPLATVLALDGHASPWPEVHEDLVDLPPLSPSARLAAQRHAAGLFDGGMQVLVVRCGLASESRAGTAAVAATLGRRCAFVQGDPAPGIGAWLTLRGTIPVLCWTLAPSEQRVLPRMAGYRGPVLVAAGLDGSVAADRAVATWHMAVPPAAERALLWQSALYGSGEPGVLAQRAALHRHGAGRIADLARVARADAARSGQALQLPHVMAAARSAAGAQLGAMAELLPDDIADSALVLAPALQEAVAALVSRCRLRDGLAASLGPAARTRYRPGVRALLVGPSGTGKTLAAGWMATRLGLPLYRVDLAAVSSKYIGETEKHLADLFAAAEHAEVVLLFDEADSLFGKRTDVNDANDRFANQQTNYLLQRIESFEGIALLTSNSRARFDSAFARRLDAIIEFPAPGPEVRRELWQAHLGQLHRVSAAGINRLAAICELSGGHIRSATLTAAARAAERDESLDEADLVAAVAAEYRKLGKAVPSGLAGVA